ncbi:unnamed protein product [Durusdinium trenchii]|uniref:Uncharacterized protein n=1 Tax=Durusdinium trenchii TaxID=1381693 RepID=A0ABP0NSS7_9DINO
MAGAIFRRRSPGRSWSNAWAASGARCASDWRPPEAVKGGRRSATRGCSDPKASLRTSGGRRCSANMTRHGAGSWENMENPPTIWVQSVRTLRAHTGTLGEVPLLPAAKLAAVVSFGVTFGHAECTFQAELALKATVLFCFEAWFSRLQ